MGYSFSWLAVADVPPTKLLERIGLVDTGEVTEPGATAYAGAVLPNGWYVIWLKEFNHEWMDQLMAESISDGGVLVGCMAAESVNASRAFLCRDVELIWEASHILDEGQDNLDVEGTPPAALSALLTEARKRAAQEGCDAVFDVPIELARGVCGFRHDACSGAKFSVLRPTDKLFRSIFR